MVLGCQMLAVAGLSQALGVEPSQAGSLIQQQQQQQRLCSIFIHSDTVLQWRALSFYLYFFLPPLSLSLSLSLSYKCMFWFTNGFESDHSRSL